MSNEELARDISSIIMSMQFQDITWQRIEHVIHSPMKFEREAKGLLQRLKSMQEIVHEGRYCATWLETTYTMEAERAVMKSTLLALNEK